MKRIFILSVLFCAHLFYGQQAGKAGELLKNEASPSEMKTPIGGVVNPEQSRIESSHLGDILKGNNGFRPPRPNFNQNHGYTEVFLRIPEGGYFSVELADQRISNASGKFRFFDLNAGKLPISIYRNGYLVYRSNLNVRNNYRLVLDFFSSQGLYLLDTYPVQGYGFNQWDDVWNNPYGQGGGFGGVQIMNDVNFNAFLQALKRNNFDDAKLDFVRSEARNTGFTAQQIAEILKNFSFDDRRLQAGKLLYGNCVDPQNFFIVYNTFSFDSNRRALMEFVSRNR